MRIGNFAIRKMRNYYNRRTRFAWLLMMVYLPMLLAITFHYHSAAEGDSATVYCSDCDHHVHHDGHLATSPMPIKRISTRVGTATPVTSTVPPCREATMSA